MEWIRHLGAIKAPIEAKCNVIPTKIWIMNTNGANWNGKGHVKVMISWAMGFIMSEFARMLGQSQPHHNMQNNMEVLVERRIMVQTINNLHQDVFGIVDNKRCHIKYKQVDNNDVKLITWYIEEN